MFVKWMLQRKLVWSQQLEFHHQEKEVSFFCTVTGLSCTDVFCKFNTFKLYSYRVQTTLVGHLSLSALQRNWRTVFSPTHSTEIVCFNPHNAPAEPPALLSWLSDFLFYWSRSSCLICWTHQAQHLILEEPETAPQNVVLFPHESNFGVLFRQWWSWFSKSDLESVWAAGVSCGGAVIKMSPWADPGSRVVSAGFQQRVMFVTRGWSCSKCSGLWSHTHTHSHFLCKWERMEEKKLKR